MYLNDHGIDPYNPCKHPYITSTGSLEAYPGKGDANYKGSDYSQCVEACSQLSACVGFSTYAGSCSFVGKELKSIVYSPYKGKVFIKKSWLESSYLYQSMVIQPETKRIFLGIPPTADSWGPKSELYKYFGGSVEECNAWKSAKVKAHLKFFGGWILWTTTTTTTTTTQEKSSARTGSTVVSGMIVGLAIVS